MFDIDKRLKNLIKSLELLNKLQLEDREQMKALRESQEKTEELIKADAEIASKEMKALRESQEKIGELLQEHREQMKANAEIASKEMKKLRESQEETWELLQEYREQMKANAEIASKEMKANAEIASKEMKALRESQEKTDQRLDRLSKLYGGMADNQGEYAEEFFWQSLRNRKELNGIRIDYSDRRAHRKKGKIEDEYDIVLWNGSSVILVEIKWKLHPNDLIKIKEKKIPNFRKLFPEQEDHKIYVAVASFSMADDLINTAKADGFFILRQAGNDLIIESDELKAY